MAMVEKKFWSVSHVYKYAEALQEVLGNEFGNEFGCGVPGDSRERGVLIHMRAEPRQLALAAIKVIREVGG